MTSSPNRRLAGIGLAAIAAGGAGALLYATHREVGISPDAIIYIRAAREALAGEPMTVMASQDFSGPVPMSQYPPGWPLILAAVGSLGVAVEEAARWINALLFGVTSALAGAIVLRLTGSTPAALLAALLALLSFDMFNYHYLALSDPVAYASAFLALYLLDRHLVDGGPWHLAGSIGATAIGLLTRYTGVGLVAAGAVSILAFGAPPLRKRLRGAFAYGALSGLPLMIWLLVGREGAAASAYDKIVFTWPHWPTEIPTLAAALTRFVWPIPIGWPRGSGGFAEQTAASILALALVAAAAGLLAIGAARLPERGGVGVGERRSRLAELLLTFCAFHLAVHYAALCLIAPSSFLAVRYFLPVGLAVTLLTVAFCARVAARRRSLPVRFALALLAVGIVAVQLTQTAPLVGRAARLGLGLNFAVGPESPTLAWLGGVDPQRQIFSDRPHVIYFRTGRDARFLPSARGQFWETEDRGRFGRNPEYDSQMAELRREIAEHDALVVLVGPKGNRRFPGAGELVRELPIELAQGFDDGEVYVRRAPERPREEP